MKKAPPRVKIKGARGDWTALVAEQRLTVIHNIWWDKRSTYFDPMVGVKFDGKRFGAFLDALQTYPYAVMQKTAEDGTFTRLGYIDIFDFTDLQIPESGGVSLKITGRHFVSLIK